jgi:hypothetical protein
LRWLDTSRHDGFCSGYKILLDETEVYKSGRLHWDGVFKRTRRSRIPILGRVRQTGFSIQVMLLI